MSKEAILLAYKKGYRATDDGRITGKQVGYLKLRPGTTGYPLFKVWNGNKTINVPAHRFAAYCFFGEELFEHECVRHKDAVKMNIRRDNLELGSLSDNFYDRDEEWRRNFFRKWSEAKQKLSSDEVREVRELISRKKSYSSIAERFGVSKSAIQQIKEGKTYKWVD